ncbi:MAG: NADH-quinone oxidoreductase subunit M [Chloroherpetonaceae bacterium]|nr:NADH-quinone oxidoreductase subunit M [Chloroherpetonaceae bacterium]MDW8437246.1 NADH-quinone oxidoreductase subunit M [Chloroherpetonaceae bacterium]
MLTLITFLPLIAALVILLIPKERKQAMRWISLLAAAGQVALAFWIWKNYDPSLAGVDDASKFQFVERAAWFSVELGNYVVSADYFMGIDGISVAMVILTAIVALVGVGASWTIEKSVKGYFVLYNLMSTSMMGTFLALDFFLFYVFWEATLIPMYFLIGIWGGKNREYAAIKFIIYTLVGSVLMLLAMIGLYASVADPATGRNTFSLVAMANQQNFISGSALFPTAENHLLRTLAFFALFLAFVIKVPMVPFHTWLPDAHVEAPTPISVVLAGVLLKLGGYGLLRINFPIFPDIFQEYAWWIALFGVISIVYGAFCAIAQTDFKKMVAYSSVSHMGFALLGIAAVNSLGMSGAMLQMFSHGILSPMMFLLVGVIYDRAHTREMEKFGGLAKYMPIYAGFILVAFMGNLGMPAMSGFVAEAFVFLGAFSQEQTRILAVVGTLGILLSATYLLRAYRTMFTGERKPNAAYEVKGHHGEEHAHFHDWKGNIDMDGREIALLAPLAAIVILVGVYPAPVLDLMTPSLNKVAEILSAATNIALK